MAWSPRPGDAVAWWDGDRLEVAIVAAEEKRRLRLVRPDGKEVRIAPGRLAFPLREGGEAPGADDASRGRAVSEAGRLDRSVRELAATVDVPLVWELVRESGEDADPAALADLTFEDPGDGGSAPARRAALIRAFLDDGVHFVRRGDAWVPRPDDAVQRLLHEREAVARLERERARAREELEGLGRGEAPDEEPSPATVSYLDALERVALHEDAAERGDVERSEEALAIAGIRHDRVWEGAFRLLRVAGRIRSDDENLAIRRYRLATEFSPEVREAAAAAARRGFERAGRRDLTAIPVVTIDGPRTRELDDGLSASPLPGGGVSVGVHIADPAAFVDPGDPVDVAAAGRAVTHFFPEGKLNMLPPELGESAASLVAGEERPAVSFLIEVASDGSVRNAEIVRSVVRVAERIDYDAADAVLEGGAGPLHPLLSALDAAAASRESHRLRNGAVVLLGPEVDVFTTAGGDVVLERLPGRSRSRRLVTEAMVLAGAVAAEFCERAGVPLIYRRQAPPEAKIEGVEQGPVDDPVEIHRLRRLLRRGETGLRPGAHHALGLECYAQATSPLRRYQDLANHRQIVAAVEGRPPAYDEAELRRIAATTERAEAEARRAERDRNRYWLLRYLEARVGQVVEGLVVEDVPRPVVLLDDTLLERPVPALAGTPAGDRVRLEVVRVNPRADLLVLRRA